MNQTLKIARDWGGERGARKLRGIIQNNPLPAHKKIITNKFIKFDFLLDSNHQMDFT